MTRIGFYTGRLYDSSVPPESIGECCEVLRYKEPILEDEPLILRKRTKLKLRCALCSGECPESQK